jgi:hypothetical protein
MNGKDSEGQAQERTTDIVTIPPSPYTEERKPGFPQTKVVKEHSSVEPSQKKKKNIVSALGRFVYNPQRKTVLGRNALNWGKI